MNIYLTSNISKLNEFIDIIKYKNKNAKFIVSHIKPDLLKKIVNHHIKFEEKNNVDFFNNVIEEHFIDIIISNYSKETFGHISKGLPRSIHGTGDKVNLICPVEKQETLNIINNKILTYDILKDKIILPKYTLITNKEEFLMNLSNFTQPCIKPNKSIFGIGFYNIYKTKKKCSQYQMLESEYDKKVKSKSNIMMEFLPGFEYSCDTLCQNGKLLLCLTRKKINDTKQQLVHNELIYKDIEHIVKTFNLHGTINIQFKEDSDCIPNFLEINPRISGGFFKSLSDHEIEETTFKIYADIYNNIIHNIHMSDNYILKNKIVIKSLLEKNDIYLTNDNNNIINNKSL